MLDLTSKEISVVLHNVTNERMYIYKHVPVLQVSVDATFGKQMEQPKSMTPNSLWSCPKCKHGGAHNEHNRIPGKCRYAPRKMATADSPDMARPSSKPVSKRPGDSILTPAPNSISKDPDPLLNPDDSITLDANPAEAIPPATSGRGPDSQKPAVSVKPSVTANNDSKIKSTYKRFNQVSVTDVVLRLHEQLKNLDIVWIKRLLISIVGENLPSGDDSTTQSLMSGKDTSGTVLLLREIPS